MAVYKVSVVELDGWEKYKMEIKSDIACMWLSELLCELNALSVLKRGVGSCMAVGAAGCNMLWGRVAGLTVCMRVYECVCGQ